MSSGQETHPASFYSFRNVYSNSVSDRDDDCDSDEDGDDIHNIVIHFVGCKKR